MKKSLLILACLSLPLSLMAADGNKRRDERDGAKAVESVASAPARARDALEQQAHERRAHEPAAVAQHRAEQVADVRAAKDRGSRMGGCRKEAQDQGLGGADLKVAIAECMKRAN